MRVRATTDAPAATGADTIVVGVFEGEGVAHDLEGAPLGALLEAGEAKTGFKKVAFTRAEGRRWLLVGLGRREEFDAERARRVAGVLVGRLREVAASVVCWELPHHVEDAVAGALVEGTLMGAYRFDAYKSATEDDGELSEVVISAHHDVAPAVSWGQALAVAANRTRDLQNMPANEATPTRLAARAREIAAEHGLSCEILGREQIRAAGMGAFAAVTQGSEEEPALITLRYAPDGAAGPVLGFVGKAVTFDSGGISLKPGMGMGEMKFDMSGGAAVLEAVACIATLGLPVPVVAVVGATENLQSGRAMKPGDIVRAKSGTTIEILNTDAEGRLVLCDCLVHARECGAERLVDVATLTGGIVTTFGTVYTGLMGTDDAWCAEVEAAGARTGELVWRLPLHPDYDEAMKGTYADLQNINENRKATSITAGTFLKAFVDDVPWAHLDIAGTAWDRGKEYAKKGGAATGTRLLVELAAAHAAR